MRRRSWGLTLVMVLGASPARALENGLARTPPMGWNGQNKFGCNVSDELVRKMAYALIATGMRDAGYVYVNLDDCWHGERDQNGYLQPDKARFPRGMEDLADFLHRKGLKLGIHSNAGTKTCSKRPGSLGHEAKDAEQFANWGVDYVKHDWCNTEGLDAEKAYATMRDALVKTQRPMVFSISDWGTNQPWTWAAPVANLWRTTGDVGVCWEKPACQEPWETGVMNVLDLQVGLETYAGAGHFNDPDILQVGNGMSDVEDRAHFSLWALLAAPLLAGNDLTAMNAMTRETLTNREVIAVNQDALGVQGSKVRDDGNEEVWVKPLRGGARAVVFLNRGRERVRIKVRFTELGFPTGPANVRNLWLKQDAGTFTDGYSEEVASHGVVMLRVTRASPAELRKRNQAGSSG